MDLLIYVVQPHNCFQMVNTRNHVARRVVPLRNTRGLGGILSALGRVYSGPQVIQGYEIMQDIITRLGNIHRPAILVRAANIGKDGYRRGPILRRILGRTALPRSAVALFQLIEIEADLNTRRKKTDAGYNLVRHIEVMIAIVAEAELLRATPRSAPD